jgi:hypothetical protein
LRFGLLLASLVWTGTVFAAGQVPEEVTRVRDPFKKPTLRAVESKPRSELELYPVEKFKLVAVITGPKKLRAMLQGPDGKSYFVAEGMAIGFRKGVIRKITHDAVLVREQVLNVLGQEENVDSDLKLPEEGKSLGEGNGISGQGSVPAPAAGSNPAVGASVTSGGNPSGGSPSAGMPVPTGGQSQSVVGGVPNPR